jgi:hypothetical protein
MRRILLATAATFGVTLGGAAMAQYTNPDQAVMGGSRPGHEPGVGLSEPASGRASNITPGDARSTIAPRLPGAAIGGENLTAADYLREAQSALVQGRTGAAQEALERAETRLLDRSTPQGMTDTPTSNPVAQTISQARDALGHHDLAGAGSLISRAMSQVGAG